MYREELALRDANPLEDQTWKQACELLKLCESHFSPHVRTWAVYTFMWVHEHVFNVTFNWKEILM